MAALTIREEEQISAVREFNRFYTARLGLLRKRHLDGEFSLTEARMLYEIGATPGLTASSLRNTLGLDAGYVSRSLALLTRRKLVRQAASKHDGREKLLTLLPAEIVRSRGSTKNQRYTFASCLRSRARPTATLCSNRSRGFDRS